MYFVGAFFTVFLVAALVLQIFEWRRVARLYRGSRAFVLRQMFFTVRKCQRWWIFPGAAIMVAGTLYLISDPLFRETVPVEALVPALLAVPLSTILIRLRPPAAIFLGSSAYGKPLYSSLRLRIGGYRIIAFLASPDLLDGFRSGGRNDWSDVVRPLTKVIPLIVADARFATAPVTEELRWLMGTPRGDRVIFVSTDAGKMPTLDALGIALPRGMAHVTTAAKCADMIRQRLATLRSQRVGTAELEPRTLTVLNALAESVPVQASRARVEIRVAGFLFSAGLIGPVGCMRQGKSLGLKGAVGVAGMGDDFVVFAEGDPSTLAEYVRSMEEACPLSVRVIRRLGFAGGLLVEWHEATGQFDTLPSEMPFMQFPLEKVGL